MKKYSILFALTFGAFFANGQDKINQSNKSNHRSWAVGLNVANTFTYGDLVSFQKDKHSDIDAGGIEIGAGLNVTRFWNPTLGTRIDGGFYTVSGSGGIRGGGYNGQGYFEGKYMQGSANLLVNLSNLVITGKSVQRKNALLFGVGVGFMSYSAEAFDSTGEITLGETGNSDHFNRAIANKSTSQFYVPLTLEYKRKLTNALDLDLGLRYIFTGEDWLDAYKTGDGTDRLMQAYLGVSYNFGQGEKASIIYTNPLDDMMSDVEEVKDNFDQLTTDDDKDGVSNLFDKDNSTPEGTVVDGSGKALDIDKDGIPDNVDQDPFTQAGARVDGNGRAIDSDGDGIPDHIDKEANTPEGTFVNFEGVSIGETLSSEGSAAGGGGAFIPSVYFAYNSSSVSAANFQRLTTIAQMLQTNSGAKIQIVGNTDVRGTEEYNKNLGMRRAEAVKQQLVQVFGIDASRIETVSEGKSKPVAASRNDVNRRADITMK